MTLEVGRRGQIKARVVADSISPAGIRLVTFEVEFPRFILPQVLTHRLLSRNTASTRAVPTQKTIERVRENPTKPLHWGKNRPGMQAYEECNSRVVLGMFQESVAGMFEQVNVSVTREQAWDYAAAVMCDVSEELSNSGYHKQVAGRLIETFQSTKMVISATEFCNFFWLRRDKDAQPEIKELADRMWEAMEASEPQQLEYGEWHLPYVHTYRDEISGALDYVSSHKIVYENEDFLTLEQAQKVSVSCCAQVSYRRNDTSLEKAEKIYDMLVTSRPVHASALEHCATPMKSLHGKYWPYDENKRRQVEKDQPGVTHRDVNNMAWSNNLRGWVQYRALVPENTCWQYSPSEEE